MANWLKEEITQAEAALKNTVEEASHRLEAITKQSIEHASAELNQNIGKLIDTLAEQRIHTKTDLKELVNHAALWVAGLMVLMFLLVLSVQVLQKV